MTIAEKLVELEALLEKATPGDWRYRDMEKRGTLGVAWLEAGDFTDIADFRGLAINVNGVPCRPDDGMIEANARLTAWLKNEAPALIRSLASQLDEARSALRPFAEATLLNASTVIKDGAKTDLRNVVCLMRGDIGSAFNGARKALGSEPT
jgi:hypothetical protein